MLFYPERVALTGALVYLALWLVSPLDLVFPVSWASLGYVALCYVAFFVGCLMVAGRGRPPVAVKGNGQFRSRAFWTFAAIGAIGMALRVYDKWILRGAGLASSAMESRELLADAAAGPLAALGGMLYPFCFVPLILWWARPAGSRPLLAKWVAVTLFMLPALDALLLLSRSQMLVTFSMMYFAASCVIYRGRLLPRRLIWPVLFGVSGLIAVSVITFITRLDQMAMDLVFSILNSAYGYVVTPSTFALDLMNQVDSMVGATLTTLLPILQYYVHGLFEFGLLWDRPDEQVFSLGTQHFAPYLKAFSLFGLASESSTTDLYYRAGVFTTFFGPLWVDFGWVGPLFMIGFGALCKYVAQRARKGNLAAMPLHAYLCAVLFFMPVVNFVISAQGMYVINAFVIFWWVSRSRSSASVPKTGSRTKAV